GVPGLDPGLGPDLGEAPDDPLGRGPLDVGGGWALDPLERLEADPHTPDVGGPGTHRRDPTECAAYDGWVLGSGSVTLFRLGGIRVSVDWSWFIVLFLVIFWLSDFYATVLGESSSDTTPFVLAVTTAIAFFASIVIHEFGHAIVAKRN